MTAKRPIQEGDQARYVAGYWLECQPAKGQIVDVLEAELTEEEPTFWCEWVADGREYELLIPAADLELIDEDT